MADAPKRNPHVERKSAGKPLDERERSPDQQRKDEILKSNSQWVIATEVRLKYEVVEDGKLQTYEVYLDPGKLNSIHFAQQDCDAARKGSNHNLLTHNGENDYWARLVGGDQPTATRPERTNEPGRFRSSHGPLCLHEFDCTWYCVCGPLGLISDP